MTRKIIIRITKDGNVKIEAKGYKGDQCLKATEPFEKAFGDIESRTLKDSYYESPEQEENYAYA